MEWRFEPNRGKGSHGKLTVGEYSTIVPDKEIRPGLFAAILRDLSIDRRDFQSMKFAYPCLLHPEEGGGFYVVFPDVPGALTCGDDRAEALNMAEDALTIMLGEYVERERELPTPSPVGEGQDLVFVPPLAAAKLSIYAAMRRQGIGKADLAQRLGLSEPAVEKLLVPDRHSPWGQVTRALDLLGRKLVVEDRAA